MLRITADVFSGRPNPSWLIEDEAEAKAVLRELARNRDLYADGEAVNGGLGLRGFRLEPLGDELAHDYGLGDSAYVSVTGAAAISDAAGFAERLVGLIGRDGVELEDAPRDAVPLEQSLADFLTGQLEAAALTATSQVSATDGQAADAREAAAPGDVTCMIELGAFNPGFWNNDPTVRSSNNCYNYASNWRTNTFAQPGRGCGNIYTRIDCAEVSRAALCDGMHHRFDCFPDTEKPRYLVALVIAPGPGFVDYHWFRKQKEGFWGHKPGGTAARNTDNSNQVIFNPETANRGPYTIFCGYFYGCNSQRRRIR
jgi:hypothetical protein